MPNLCGHTNVGRRQAGKSNDVKDRIAFAAILVLQVVCTFFFLQEIVANLLGWTISPRDWRFLEMVEIGAAVGLLSGIALTGWLLARSLRRTQAAEDSLRMASGAFADVLEERFQTWQLTPAERDVALFAIKGLTLAEIAAIRSTSEGTVKAQTNAIYRKAGVKGRAQLLSLFIDELMDDSLMDQKR